MNLLEYEIDWDTKSKFEKSFSLDNYLFLLTAFIHIKQKTFSKIENGRKYFNVSDELSYEYGPINNEDFKEDTFNRIYSLSLAYLERYCSYEDILMDIRWSYDGLTYNDYLKSRPKFLKERLVSVMMSSVRSLYGPKLIEIEEFEKYKSNLRPEHQDIYSDIDNYSEKIFKIIREQQSDPYTHLIMAVKVNRKDEINKMRATLRLEHNQSFFTDEGIKIKDFHTPTRLFSPYNLKIAPSVEYIEANFLKTPQKIALFQYNKFHSLLVKIADATIKLGLLDEMNNLFRTEPVYKPNIYVVDGAQNAVDKYGSLFIKNFELYHPSSLSKKIETLCYKTDSNHTYTKLKKGSIMKAIHRNKLFE
ncbi:MAG: hypothetical protein JJ958_12020 [Balneola sp.]|nr:hypothetical protein [Balneola sp.]